MKTDKTDELGFWPRPPNQDALIPAHAGSNPAKERHCQNHRRIRQKRLLEANRQRPRFLRPKHPFPPDAKKAIHHWRQIEYGAISDLQAETARSRVFASYEYEDVKETVRVLEHDTQIVLDSDYIPRGASRHRPPQQRRRG